MSHKSLRGKEGTRSFFLWKIGWMLSVLMFVGNLNAQTITTSGCGVTSNIQPYAGTSSIFRIDISVPCCNYCDGFAIYENGVQLKCNEMTTSVPMGCAAHNGNFIFQWDANPQNHTLYLDTRNKPYTLSTTPPTGISVGVIQTPPGPISKGSPVTLTADVVILGSSVTATGYQWYRNGQPISGANNPALVNEVPVVNGTRYSVTVNFSDGSSLPSDVITVLFSESINDGRFTFSGELANTMTIINDECNSIYELDLTFSREHYASFQMYENGTQLTNSMLNVNVPGLSWNGNNIVYQGGTNTRITCFLNTRVTPYELTAGAPVLDPNYLRLTLDASTTTIYTAGEQVTLTADICPTSGTDIFQWFENGVLLDETTTKSFNVNPTKNGDTYTVVVNGNTSNEVRIFFADACNYNVSITHTQGISGNACAIDECYTIYEINLQATDMYYSFFRITQFMGPDPLPLSGSLPSGMQFENNGIVYRNAGTNGRNVTIFLNTRDGQYVITTTQPNLGGYFKIDLTADRTVINQGESVTLTADVCPSGDYSYVWLENGVKIDETTTPEIVVTPGRNGNKYTVIVNGTTSNVVRILFAEACDGRITAQSWYGAASVTGCGIDACNAVYELVFNLANDAHFVLREDGVAIGATLQGNVRLRFERGSDGTPAFRNTGGTGTFTYYLDTRGDQYIISDVEPVDAPYILIKAIGGTEIIKCSPIEIESCPDLQADYTYQWYKNGEPMEGENGVTLNDPNPLAGDQYYLELTPKSVGTLLTSKILTISYALNPPLPGVTTIAGPAGFDLNNYEHEIHQGNSFTITTSIYDPNLTYTLQYRSLEAGSVWKDTTLTPVIGDNVVFTIRPSFGAEYRVKGADEGGCVEHYSRVFLVRVIYTCSSQEGAGESQVLFFEDFGTLPSADAWRADTEGHVRNHIFAGNSCNTECWCAHRRIADGFYAIVANPKTSDCLSNSAFLACSYPYTCGNGDYWYGPDHTGNENGGMLFINVDNNGVGMVVYERPITVEKCKGVKVLFSAFIGNATIKGTTPVNVRLDIWNSDKTKLIHSISSGNVITRTQAIINANPKKAWSNLSFKFDATEEDGEYILQLTNNTPGGSGNDILLDDISVTVCYPTIDIQTNTGDLDVKSCFGTDTVIVLKAVNDDIKDYIPDPYFLFQYKRPGMADWDDLRDDISGETILRVDTLNMRLTKELFRGNTQVRLIVAPDAETINRIKAGTMPPPDCDNFYAVSGSFNVDFNFFEAGRFDTIVCPGMEVSLPEDFPLPDDTFEWKLYVANDASKTPVIAGSDSTSLYNKFEEFTRDLTFESPKNYILAFETPTCIYDGEKGAPITIDRKLNVGLDFTVNGSPFTQDTLRICNVDETTEIELVVVQHPKEVHEPWIWKVNGMPIDNETATLNMQTIVGMGIEKGEITAMANYLCTDTIRVPFKIYKNFNVTLTIDGLTGAEKLCLSSNTDVNTPIVLTAELDFGDENYVLDYPISYYWYKQIAPGGFVAWKDTVMVNDTDIRRDVISSNGIYAYRVIAIDNICYSSTTDLSGDNVGDTSFVAARQMIIDILPAAPVVICKGEGEVFAAEVTNWRPNLTYIWTGAQVNLPTDSIATISNVQTSGSVSVTVIDEVCGNPTPAVRQYELLESVEKPVITQAGPVCVTGWEDITLELENPINGVTYTWYWYDNETGGWIEFPLQGTTLTITEGGDFTFKLGNNQIKVIAQGCNEEDTDETITIIEAKAPIVLTLSSNPSNLEFCATTNPSIQFNVQSSVAGLRYYWELIDETNDEVTVFDPTDAPTNTISLTKGTNGFVRVYVVDVVCPANPAADTLYYNISEQINIRILAEDENGNPISGGQICSKYAYLWAEVLNDGDPTGYEWTWSYERDADNNDFAAKQRVALTSELTEFRVTVEKDGACSSTDAISIGNGNLIVVDIQEIGGKGITIIDGKKYRTVCANEEIELTAVSDPFTSPGNFAWQLPVSESTVIKNGIPQIYSSNQVGKEIIVVQAVTSDEICINTDTLFLTVQEPSIITLATSDGIYNTCYDGAFKEVTLEISIIGGNQHPQWVSWNGNDSIDVVFNEDHKIVTTVNVSGRQTYTAFVVDSVCGRSNEDYVYISVTPRPNFTLVANPDLIEVMENTTLTANISLGDEVLFGEKYEWWNDEGWSAETETNTTLSGIMENAGIFTFFVTTQIGDCKDTTSAIVEVVERIPNIITPYNFNDLNDVFFGRFNNGNPRYQQLEIFNRYQQVVFRDDKDFNGWNGTYRGQLAEPGTYFYRVVMRSGRVFRGTIEVAKF